MDITAQKEIGKLQLEIDAIEEEIYVMAERFGLVYFSSYEYWELNNKIISNGYKIREYIGMSLFINEHIN
jgi:hypothetical protein